MSEFSTLVRIDGRNRTTRTVVVVDESEDGLILDAGWEEFLFNEGTGKLFKFTDDADSDDTSPVAGKWRFA